MGYYLDPLVCTRRIHSQGEAQSTQCDVAPGEEEVSIYLSSGAKVPEKEHQTISYEMLRVLPCPRVMVSSARVET